MRAMKQEYRSLDFVRTLRRRTLVHLRTTAHELTYEIEVRPATVLFLERGQVSYGRYGNHSLEHCRIYDRRLKRGITPI